jgi:LysR family nitrogen assimilation transcriptional regulator
MQSRQLRYFAAVAEAGRFTAAAARLRVAQPALSRQIAALERDLGVALFVRQPGGVTLTEAGEIMRRHAEAMRLQAARAREEIADAGGEASGWMSFGANPSLGRLLFAPVADAMIDRFPRIRLSFVEGVGAQLLNGITDGTIDLAIASKPAYAPGIAFRQLMSEPVFLVAAADKPPLPAVSSWEDLGGLPLVVTNQQTTIASWVEEQSGLARTDLDLRFRVESAYAALDLVRRGLAYGVVPQSALDERGAGEALQAVRMESVTLDRYLAWSRRRERSSAFEAFGETVAQAMRAAFPMAATID